MKDLIESSVDVAVTTHNGDIDIAEDQLKSSAWLVALATAALYFCFQEIDAALKSSDQESQKALLFGYLIAGAALALSFCTAYFFRKAHGQLSAYLRNMLCAIKALKSELLENIDKVEKFRKTMDKNIPFWMFVYSGQIYSAIDISRQQRIANTEDKIKIWRDKVDCLARLQRQATLFGFLLLISLKLVGAVIHVAI